jgi:3-oxoacyl-[acyl-carrier-protein] synthase II
MSGIRIIGTAQISACGAGMDALGDSLEGPAPEPEWVSITPDELGPKAPVLRARPTGMDDVVPARSVRRLDQFSSNFIYAARLAVMNSAIELPEPERIGVVTGTAYGSLATSISLLHDFVSLGDDAGSPFKFTNAANNASATSVATSLGARGPCLSVLGFQDIMLNVLRVASGWLEQGMADVVIAGAGDEFHPLVGYGLHHLSGWADDGRLRPLDFGRTTYVPGETFAVILLTRTQENGKAKIESTKAYADLAADYRPGPNDLQIVAADGRLENSAAYSALAEGGAAVAAYTSLWGGNPSAEMMSVLVASMSVEQGRYLTAPDSSNLDAVLDHGVVNRVAVVAANADGSGSVATITREHP